MDDLQAQLRPIAAASRAFLELIWPEWHGAGPGPVPAILSTRTCGRSSLFLRNALRAEGRSADWVSGMLLPDHAPCEAGGAGWHHHAWVVSGGFIVDITADQFGAPPVVVIAAADARYRPGRDPAWPHAIRARHAAVAAIWPAWLAARRVSPRGT
jgi:hypothetical protein